MWPYQGYFRSSARAAAKGIFSILDKSLFRNVFLIGVLVEDREDRHPVCLEPEDCGYKVTQFTDVRKQAHHLESVDEERRLILSPETDQEKHIQGIRRRALRNAVQRAVSRDDKQRGVVSHCSWPILVDGYQVMVVLQFNRGAWDSHYSLVKKERDVRNIRFYTSLLDAGINEYFSLCERALLKAEPTEVMDREHDEVVRAAGRLLMYTPSHAGVGFMEGLHGLFEACNIVSSLRHEGEECIARMLVARRGHPNVEVTLALAHTVNMRDYRAVRKLLEMSSDELYLLSDSGSVYGLGTSIEGYDLREESLFQIRFVKHYTWELFHAEHLMMQVRYGQPTLPKDEIGKDKFGSNITRIFSHIDSNEISRLWKLILEATKQDHGTVVVISTGARKEAQRLKNQATIIEPIRLSPQLMRVVTAIDGAVLIDQSSTCHAIGVILDGLATEEGDPSRGARYNSAIRYVESSKHRCLVLIVSEDGSTDWVSSHSLKRPHKSE